MKKLMALIVFSLVSVSIANAQYSNRTYARNDQYNSRYASKARGGAAAEINMLQKQARERIADGIVSGRITANESKNLLSLAEKIEWKENQYMRNGRLTNREINELKKDIHHLNNLITRNLKDHQTSPVDHNARRRF
ncbi:hypothetical protein LAG90_04500 [Marinilongibacter aquaticus]|uniref:hypothetical protein n=1 Tax=Marinilongibacter aquaticus TaxID=2975157 RepID=UPI0021BD9125|nr:hypothetical protein [Marinilongibacter aquaticus]UBM59907.1 hypothetical protein LAG90_04500 [Marinilongibacter aquaticus]